MRRRPVPAGQAPTEHGGGFSALRHLAGGALALAVIGAAVAALTLPPLLAELDETLRGKFEGRRWDVPSRVLSDAFLLYPGLDMEAIGLADRLARLNYRETDSTPPKSGGYRRTADTIDLGLRGLPYEGNGPAGRPVRIAVTGRVVTRITDLHSGEELSSLALEPEQITGLYESSWEERRVVSLAEIPPRLVRAILLTEDQRFYEHHGIDPVGIARALAVNLRHGRVVQGGSTLTQQLMKNFFLSEARTWRRKLREAAMALLAERRYSKQQILENYLNEIYLGQDGVKGIFGVWEGAEFYFGRSPLDLSLGETALLAGLIRAPNAYSPFNHPERARTRRDTVLRLLAEAGNLTAAEYAEALAEPMPTGRPRGGRNAAPYFVDFLRDELVRDYGEEVLTSQGLSVFTTLDVELQQFAERAVEDGLAALERRHPRFGSESPDERVQACLVAMQPQTGAIRAMVGGRDYASSQFNRAVQARRQPGSVFKPFVYLAAFEVSRDRAEPLSPTAAVLDEPFEWIYDSQSWRPSNYHDAYLGSVPLRKALEMSLNAATARIARDVGLEPIRDLARRLGIQSDLPAVPSMVLGSLEASPLEIAEAYSVLANQGVRAFARATRKVVDQSGAPVQRHPLEAERAVSAEAAYLVTHLMEGVVERGTGRGARELGFDRPAAGKTGTTNESRDAWFAGFTPDLLAVVWVGFDAKRPLGLTGAEAALPIWTLFMKAATAGDPPSSFHPPEGIVLVRIDPHTGGIATPACPETLDEAFWTGFEPTRSCPLHGSRDRLEGTADPSVVRPIEKTETTPPTAP